MITRRFVLIGFSACLFLSAGSAEAQCPEGKAAQYLGFTPISSHYTARVIERAETGISLAESSSTSTLDFLSLYFDWLNEVTRFIAEIVDTDLRITQENYSLREHTPCLFLDLAIIESEMEKVRCILSNEALDVDWVKAGQVMELESVLLFLNERYRNLIAGANDPSYVDTGWQVRNSFDPEGEGDLGEPPMCPFHSNYLPPTVHGYGCDTEVLGQYDVTPVEEENDALQELIETRNEFIHDVEDLDELIVQLDWYTGETPPDLRNFGMALDREHEEVSGCLEEWTTVSEGEPMNAIFKLGGTKWEKRGPFSFTKDEPRLMREFLEGRTAWGEERPQSDEFKIPEEFPEGDERDEAQQREDQMSFLDIALRDLGRLYLRWWNVEQGREESSIVAKASDPQLQLKEQFQKLRDQMRWLGELASKKDAGSRDFGRKLAYFLRTSCMERPCKKQLNNVLKFLLTDQCFPFVNGSFEHATDDIDILCIRAAQMD